MLSEQHLLEIQTYGASLIVHFYGTTPEAVLKEEDDKFHRLAQICLDKGQTTIACIRSIQVCQPVFGDINDVEKRWRLECERIRNKKVTYLS